MAKSKAVAICILLLYGSLCSGITSGINTACKVQVEDIKDQREVSDARNLLLVAKSQIGIRELTGNNDGDQIRKYLNSTGLDEGYAWCAAFVNWCHDQAGLKGSGSAWSPAWFPKSKLVSDPLPGDVFGIYFRSKGRVAHVGFIEKMGSTVITIEGNTNDAGSREGDGVYRKRRLLKQIYQTSRWR